MVKGLIDKKIKALWSEIGQARMLVFCGEVENQGDLYTNAALMYAKIGEKKPVELAQELIDFLKQDREINNTFEKIEVAGPGFVNFYYAKNFLQKQLSEISRQENYGLGNSLKGQTVMIEFTDANPFKLFHIGHLMSNTIGESIARLHEAVGAKVIRANYQGDVGLHVAMAVWSMKNFFKKIPDESATLVEKVNYLGQAYTNGSLAYYKDVESNFEAEEMRKVNQQIYSREDEETNRLYDLGRKWSLEYFEEIYKKLGTKFDEYFFESKVGKEGIGIVEKNKSVFEESEGATIFKGDNYGLHTRVFVNSKGLPTYEAKELGLNKIKFEKYPDLDLSIIITSNEVNDYFKVLMKVMELTMQEVAKKTKHASHGFLRLASGKMSSRTGEVITAESLIQQVQEKLKERSHEIKKEIDEQENNLEAIAIGVIKYSILKQSPGRDIIFDFDRSMSLEGDSGPYIQYAHARLGSILTKAGKEQFSDIDYGLLEHETELAIIKHLLRFPEIIESSITDLSPNIVALYTYQLANLANNFYEKVRILQDENRERVKARLVLVSFTAQIISRGLNILGIQSPNRI